MESFQQIIDAFGVSRLVEAIGVTESHARVMRARDSIPPIYWPDLVAKAPRDLNGGVTFDVLKKLRAGRFSDPSRPFLSPDPSDPSPQTAPIPLATEAEEVTGGAR